MQVAHELFVFRRAIALRDDDSVERYRFLVEEID
jgi:hypothetical protein